MNENLDPRKELKIQKGIRQKEDHLVIAVQQALDNRSSYGKLEESQFRNLIRVAESTESINVIKNFLLYLVARDQKWGQGKESLAQKIIHDIDSTIKGLAQNIAKEAQVDEFNSIWIELTRRYLGYGARYLKYKLDGES